MKPNANCPEYMQAVSVETMRESDRYTIENLVPSKVLMFRAAEGVYNSVSWDGKRIAIVCGSGNNGGDGYALAGILAKKGIMPHLYRISDKFSEDGAYYYGIAKELGVEDHILSETRSLSEYDIIVDCILGTGFKGTPRGNAETAIQAINTSGAYVVSVDINSGLDGDSGRAVVAVKSDITVSIGFYKTGMFLNDGPSLINELVNVDIGIVLRK